MARLSLIVLALCAVVATVAAHGHGPEPKPAHLRHARAAPAPQHPILVKGANSHIPQLKHLPAHHAHFSFLSKVKTFLHKAAESIKQKAGPAVAAIKKAAHELAHQVKPLLVDVEGKIVSAGKAEAGQLLHKLKTIVLEHTQGAQPAQAPLAARPKRSAPALHPTGLVVPQSHPHFSLISKIQGALHKVKAIIKAKAAPAVEAIKAKIAEAKKVLGPLAKDTKNQISSVLKEQAHKLVSKLNQVVEKHQAAQAPLAARPKRSVPAPAAPAPAAPGPVVPQNHPHFDLISKIQGALHKVKAIIKAKATPAVDAIKAKAAPAVAAIKAKIAEGKKVLVTLTKDSKNKASSVLKAQAQKLVSKLNQVVEKHQDAKAPLAARPKRSVPALHPTGLIVPKSHPHFSLISKIQGALHKVKAIIKAKAAPAVEAIKAKIAEAKKVLGPLAKDTKNQISAVFKEQAHKLVSKLNQVVEKHQGPKQA